MEWIKTGYNKFEIQDDKMGCIIKLSLEIDLFCISLELIRKIDGKRYYNEKAFSEFIPASLFFENIKNNFNLYYNSFIKNCIKYE